MRPTAGALVAAAILSASFVLAAEQAPSLMTIQAAGAKLRPLTRELPPPDPAAQVDEPTQSKEPGQTFDEYLSSNPNRPNRTRSTFYIQSIGDLDPRNDRLFDDIQEFLSIAFNTSFKRAPSLATSSIPHSVRHDAGGWGKAGFLATRLLESAVARERPKDAVSMLAVTNEELWTGEGLKIVFGRASFQRHVAAMSLARIGDVEHDPAPVLERALKVASHEVAHTIDVFHCLAFECGMNETKSLGDLNRRPLAFCSECEMKLWWACGADPVARTQRLLEFCENRRLTHAADEYRRRLQAIQRRR